jgi:hypothetical protein
VELVAGGRIYPFGAARTSPLTGMAGEVVVDAILDDQAAATVPVQIQVSARLTPVLAASPDDPDPRLGSGQSADPGRPSDPEPAPERDRPWSSYTLGEGDVLVLDLVSGELTGRVVAGPVGFG